MYTLLCWFVQVEGGQLPAVEQLAEKYEDFQMLVTLCQGIGNRSKLKEYMVRFAEQVWGTPYL